ncbi:MAG: DUF805 domain-containing protein [Lachnospiraceae bacterium]|nr:DUF805 domain-containing protein [Lachnospiraceae bacterium]
MDVNFFSAQIKQWKRIFDYKGTSTVKEFIFPVIFNVILGVIDLILTFFAFCFAANYDELLFFIFVIPASIITLYLLLSIIPGISLTVRRLRAAGKSGWWALLLLVFGIGHAYLLVLCTAVTISAGGSAFIPSSNAPEAIYGPPPEYFDPDYNQNVDVYGPPEDFEPDENQNEDVYGPPYTIEPDPNDFDPIENAEPAIYGPPEMFK